MLFKQVSIFTENKVGYISNIVNLLGNAGINIRSLQIADSSDFGILRLIVDDHIKALDIVYKAGYTARLTDVVGVIVPDKPNGLSEVLQILANNNIDIDYMYVFVGKSNAGAQAILKTADIEKTEQVLLNNCL
ncbi:MAG: ACT domain-containing protein [Anaeroplasma sp.]